LTKLAISSLQVSSVRYPGIPSPHQGTLGAMFPSPAEESFRQPPPGPWGTVFHWRRQILHYP